MKDLPFANIDEGKMVINLSTADFTIASVLNALNDCLDVLEELKVEFLGAGTDLEGTGSPSFSPANINVYFEYVGDNKARATHILEQAYRILWKSIVRTYPDEKEWAENRAHIGNFISAQSDLLIAMKSPSSEED